MPGGIIKSLAKHLLLDRNTVDMLLPRFAENLNDLLGPGHHLYGQHADEPGKTVTYSAYWTTDSGLGSLHIIGTSIATNFDPDAQGMVRGGTVYLTAKAVLNRRESALSPAFPWVVPIVVTPRSYYRDGERGVVGERGCNRHVHCDGHVGQRHRRRRWTWSENSTYATITAGGVLTASAVTSNQTVTGDGDLRGRTGTMSVTIVNADYQCRRRAARRR